MDQERYLLIKPFARKEIWDSLNSLGNGKRSGPDDNTILLNFIRDIIFKTLLLAFHQFHTWYLHKDWMHMLSFDPCV